MKGFRSALSVLMAILLVAQLSPSAVFGDALRAPDCKELTASSAFQLPLPFVHQSLMDFLPIRATASATHAALLSQPVWDSPWFFYGSEGLLLVGAAMAFIFKILPAWRDKNTSAAQWRSTANVAESSRRRWTRRERSAFEDKLKAERSKYDLSRRDFLRWIWSSGGALAALMTFVPALRYFMRRRRGRPVAAHPSEDPRVFYITRDFPVQLAAPIEANEDRAFQIRAKVFAFLDRELKSPSSIGASSPQDDVWRALNAFRDAADHRLIIMKDELGRSGTAAACQPLWVDGRAENTVFITDAFIEPLLDRSLADAQNSIARAALLTLFGKEGAIFTKVETPVQYQRQTDIFERATNFRFNPAVPMTPEQEEAVKHLATPLVDGETIGYHVADTAMTRFQLSPAALQAQLSIEPNALLRILWGNFLTLHNRIGIGGNSRQRELSLRTRVLLLDVASQFPQLINAVSVLTVVRNNQFSPGDYDVEKAFGWLLDPTYLSLILRTVPSAASSFAVKNLGSSNESDDRERRLLVNA